MLWSVSTSKINVGALTLPPVTTYAPPIARRICLVKIPNSTATPCLFATQTKSPKLFYATFQHRRNSLPLSRLSQLRALPKATSRPLTVRLMLSLLLRPSS